MTTNERLECAIEALRAHGNTQRIIEWYARWRPDRTIETTVQYSLSCALVDHALELITGESTRD